MKKEGIYTGESWEDFERQKIIDAGLDPDEVYRTPRPLTPAEKTEKADRDLKRVLLFVGATCFIVLLFNSGNSFIISSGLLFDVPSVFMFFTILMVCAATFIFLKIDEIYPKYPIMYESDETSNAASSPNSEKEPANCTTDEKGNSDDVNRVNAAVGKGNLGNSKIRYCKMCGGIIDSETKKCTRCGKQYFKFDILKHQPYIFSIMSISSFASIYFIKDLLLKIHLAGYSAAYKKYAGVGPRPSNVHRAAMYNRIVEGEAINPLTGYTYDDWIIGTMVVVGLVFATLAFCSFKKKNR